jgi:inosine-uridine nucleoside N-ribohydrolase
MSSTPPPAKRVKVDRKLRLSSGTRRYVIVDVDMSTDCAQGLMMAVSRPDVDIQAITCVSGVVNIEHTCNNVLRVLKVCGREDVSLFILQAFIFVLTAVDNTSEEKVKKYNTNNNTKKILICV